MFTLMKYLQAKRRTFRKCKDHVISKEITTVLKTAVENATDLLLFLSATRRRPPRGQP